MATYNEVYTTIETNLIDSSLITAAKHRDVEFALLDFARDQWLPGDIKEIDCTNQYIADNFDGTGLGINERLGWAICNGQNGTRNRTGRVSVGYGTSGASGAPPFPSVGATMNAPVLGGSHFHVLTTDEMPAHKHGIKLSHESGGSKDSNGYPAVDKSAPISFHSDSEPDSSDSTPGTPIGGVYANGVGNPMSSKGGGAAHNNMQPYIVTLFIQKLPNP
jgi:microcystin-dependent protein